MSENLKMHLEMETENAFVKLLRFWHDLIINPPCRTASHKFAEKYLSPICQEKLLEKFPSILYGGDTMPLPHWKTMWWYVLPQYLQGSGLNLVNILNLAKRIV